MKATFTANQRKRLAREARNLAMECIENGPEMVDFWCGCAIGITMQRAGLIPSDGLAAKLDEMVSGDTNYFLGMGLVSQATRERIFGRNPTAVVFPLLALADALESA